MHLLRRTAAAALLSALAPAQVAVDFAQDVLPILRESCFRCHSGAWFYESGRSRKPKGGLRLDGAGWIRKGGKAGVILGAGQPEQSPLYTRVVLPADDADRMPQEGDPLTAEQALVLRTWIASGADFGGWTGEPGGLSATDAAPVAAPSVQLIAQLGRGVAPAPVAALAKARGELAQITPAQPGSPLLRVEFLSNERQVTDREVGALAPLAPWITQLALGRTKITDRALVTVGAMSRLTKLTLGSTAVTDGGLLRLEALRELRSLNLYGTAVTDAGLAALGGLTELEAVYLWGTKVTERGVAELRQRLPKARVHHRLVLPEALGEPARESGRPRRR